MIATISSKLCLEFQIDDGPALKDEKKIASVLKSLH